MRLGKALAAAMQATGWSQKRLAKVSGVSQPRISEILSGYRNARPTYDEIEALELGMELPLGFVYGMVGLATREGAARGAEAALEAGW